MDGRGISELGEFELIARLRARLDARDGAGGLEIGPGDDAAAVDTGSSTLLAADMLVEGVHFDLALSAPEDVGYKAVTANVSDLAAMGGRARYLLISLALPPSATVGFVDRLYDGLLAAADDYGCVVAGGDLTSAPQAIVSISVAGAPGAAGAVRRSGAREGDVLCVTGMPGAAAAGLALMRAGRAEARTLLDDHPVLGRAHRRPVARTEAGPAAAAAGATAMIDVSDGLARDAAHLAEESGLGLVVDGASVPVSDAVAAAAALLEIDAVLLAASGGDDYELAIAVPPDRVDALRAAVAPVPLTVVGAFGGTERVFVHRGDRHLLASMGWEHFA